MLRDYEGKEPITIGMLVLHVDDACCAGRGKTYEAAIQKLRKSLNIGKIEVGEFEFLGRMVKQLDDGTVEIHQHPFVDKIQRVKMTKDRIHSPKSKLTSKELHGYRSLVGQLAWPARGSMPQLSYAVSI